MSRSGSLVAQPDGEFLCERLAETGFARAGWPVQQHHPVPGYEVCIDSGLSKQQGRAGKAQQALLDLRVIV